VAGLRVRSDEAAQGVLSLRVRRRPVGFNTGGRDTPGVMPRISLFFNDRDRARLRRSVGEQIQLVISANDYKGNGRTVIRQARLVR
jgi:hypothetical protein